MKRLLLIAFLAIVSVAAFAATMTVNWTAPTTNTDSSAIPATGPGSIVSYRIEWGTCNGTAFGTKAGEVTVTSLTGAINGLTPGTWCGRVFAMNTFGVESDASNVGSKVVSAPKPSAPSNFSFN